MKKWTRSLCLLLLAIPTFVGTIFVAPTALNGGGGGNPLNSNATEEMLEDIGVDVENYEHENWIDKRATSFSGGNGTKKAPYEISSAEELAYLAYRVNNESLFAYKKFFILTDDIVLNDGHFDNDGNYFDGGDGVLNTWTPIGIGLGSTSFYQSFFDGQGHYVHGIYIDTETEDGGLFGTITYGATLQNFKVDNSYVHAEEGGVACAGMYGKDNRISNVINCGNACFVTSGGGVCGSTINYCSIEDCINYGNIEAKKDAGGISSGHSSYTYLNNCKNYGNIKGNSVGGVVSNALRVVNCENVGEIVSGSPCGGVVAKVGNIVKGCYNAGNINVTTATNAHNIGGIVGQMFATEETSCTECINTGNITTIGFNVGGIVGGCSVSSLVIANCKNFGDLGETFVIGGIIGSARTELYLSNCENYGDISGKNYNCGGFAGVVDSATISRCANYGDLKADKVESAGLFVGRSYVLLDIFNCINFGNVQKKQNSSSVCFGMLEANSICSINSVISSGNLNNILHNVYLGTNFSEFYLDIKTGNIGLKAFSGKGLFQGKIDENILQNKGYTKKTI